MTFWHGCAMVSSKYPDRSGSGDIFEYSADAIVSMGFDSVKVYLEIGFATSYPGETWSPGSPTTLVSELQTTAFQHILSLPLQRYFFQSWAYANGNQSWWLSDVNLSQLTNEYTEMYNAASYLLQNYTNKEFIFNNWEGDWQLLGSFDPTSVIPPYRAERYASWHRARQQAIHDATRDHPSSSKVKYMIEVNRVLDDYGYRCHRDVIPFVKPDLVGWSAYESIDFWYNNWIRTAPNIHFTSGDIKYMAYGTPNGVGTYVVVGTNGQLSMSFDGLKWFPRTSGFSSTAINGVAWNPTYNLFVIVGNAGKIATSPDGQVWTLRTSGTGSNLYGVLNNTNNTLAYGAAGTLIASGDGGVTWGAPFWILGGRPTQDLTCHFYDYNAFIGAIGGNAGDYIYTDGFSTRYFSLSTGGNNINCLVSTGHQMIVGCDGGQILVGGNGFTTPSPVSSSGFSTDAIRGLAFGTIAGVDTAVAVGTNGKISTATVADWTTWTARTSGTGAYLQSAIFNPTEACFAYGCDGATGYSFDGVNWVVNGQAAMGGLSVNIFNGLFQANGQTFTLSTAGTMSVAPFWHPQSSIEYGIDYYMTRGYNILKNSIPPGTPIAITEYSFPSEMTAFTGPGPVISRTISKVYTKAQSLGIAGAIYWEIFDNEEQSVGVPKGFCIYDRNGSSTTAGNLSGPGKKYFDLFYANQKSGVFTGGTLNVDIGAPTDISGTAWTSREITVSVWFKLTDFTLASAQMLVSYDGDVIGTNLQFWAYKQDHSANDNIVVYLGDVTVCNGGPVTDNNWHHLAIVVTTVGGIKKGRVYKDGVQINSDTTVGATTAATTWKIGNGHANNRGFHGKLDEVSFWSVGFQPSDITALYNGGTPVNLFNHPQSANLLHWYRFGEGLDSTSVIKDMAHLFNGTVNGTLTFSTDVP